MYIFAVGPDTMNESYFKSEKHQNVQCIMHIHYCMELVYVYSGELIMNVNGTDRVIKGGQATLMLPFEQHSFFTPKACECVVVEFSPNLVKEFFERIKSKRLKNTVFHFDGSVIELCERYMFDKAGGELSTKASIYPLCCEIMKNCVFSNDGKTLDDTFVDAVRYICLNYKNEEMSLTEVAKVIGVHHVYLSRMFSKNAGMSFKRYLNLLRCNAAARSIKKNKEKTVSEIAFECGFGSIRSFNRQFAELFGLSPVNYRQKENFSDEVVI